MNTLIRSALSVAAFLFLAGTTSAKAVKIVEPELVGLYFHASWCSSCKVIDPKIEEASEALKKLPFLLVTFDVSNKVTQHQAGMTAAAMGYGEIYKETGLKTGFIILVDPDTKAEVGRITKSDDVASITKTIESLVES